MQIATVALALGQVGFYDEISKVHLSLESPEAKINSETNTTGLILAVKNGKIKVVSGSIESGAFNHQKARNINPTYYRLLDKKTKKKIRDVLLNQQIVEQKTITDDEEVDNSQIETITQVAIESILENTTSNISENILENALENPLDNIEDNAIDGAKCYNA